MDDDAGYSRTTSTATPIFVNVVPVVRNGLIVCDLHDGTRLVFNTPEEHNAWEVEYQRKMRGKNDG